VSDAVEFSVGQVIHHKLFGYRGVIVDFDRTFDGSEEWYEHVALSRPPRDQPWYHVLVHGATQTTYVAHRNLAPDVTGMGVVHPLVPLHFDEFRDGYYRVSGPPN
jgi:heat shock protein HspQ